MFYRTKRIIDERLKAARKSVEEQGLYESLVRNWTQKLALLRLQIMMKVQIVYYIKIFLGSSIQT